MRLGNGVLLAHADEETDGGVVAACSMMRRLLCGQVFIDKSGGKMFAERKKECLFNFEH